MDKIDPQKLQKFRKKSELDRGKIEVKYYFSMLLNELNEGRIPKSFVAFELLGTIYGAHCSALELEEILSAFPIKSWSEDTCEVPVAVLATLVEGWMDYKKSGKENRLGVVLGLEGGKGKKPIKEIWRTRGRNIRMANEAAIELDVANDTISQDAVFSQVASRFGVHIDLVKHAYHTYGREARLRLRQELDKE